MENALAVVKHIDIQDGVPDIATAHNWRERESDATVDVLYIHSPPTSDIILWHNINAHTAQWEKVKAKVRVYSPDIPVGSTYFTLITPKYLNSLFHSLISLGRMQLNFMQL